ncbi:MAG: hypothetical protein P4L87_07760 [Formivibrio sp.]|nr:hypothetical protein [Formivibrio sp.]
MPPFLASILRAVTVTLVSVISALIVAELNQHLGDSPFFDDDFPNH